MLKNSKQIMGIINSCHEEKDIGKRCRFLQCINHLMPMELGIEIPSVITHDCIDVILSSIEERLSPPIYELT